MMNWIPLTQETQLKEIRERSKQKTQVIFKHSTRCGVSSMVLHSLEKSAQPSNIDFYFLDLIKYRPVSQAIATLFNVRHESPQVLVIINGESVYDESHYAINMKEIEATTVL
jgi:bacillithiol system protein YtxJ